MQPAREVNAVVLVQPTDFLCMDNLLCKAVGALSGPCLKLQCGATRSRIAPTALLLRDSGENKKASPARRTATTIRSNKMAQTQSETLTRRDALATGAAMLGATTFGTVVLAADEPKSRRKL